jgi:hypothetical protein
MNRSNARLPISGIVVALVAIALLVAVLLANRAVPDKRPSDPAASQSATTEGENEQAQLGRTKPQAADPAPPDWALYGSYVEVKPVLGETYPDHPLRDPRPSTSSPPVGLHFPE